MIRIKISWKPCNLGIYSFLNIVDNNVGIILVVVIKFSVKICQFFGLWINIMLKRSYQKIFNLGPRFGTAFIFVPSDFSYCENWGIFFQSICLKISIWR